MNTHHVVHDEGVTKFDSSHVYAARLFSTEIERSTGFRLYILFGTNPLKHVKVFGQEIGPTFR